MKKIYKLFKITFLLSSIVLGISGILDIALGLNGYMVNTIVLGILWIDLSILLYLSKYIITEIEEILSKLEKHGENID